jgi:transposase, IS5 family
MVKRTARRISRISSRKGRHHKQRLEKQYRVLLDRTGKVLTRARELCETLENECELGLGELAQLADLKMFIERTEHVRDTARRRVLEGEQVPNEDKLFSIFEPHTQLYKRGKAGQPMQFGRLVLVYEDAAGFIIHQQVMPRDVQDSEVVVPQTRMVQDRYEGRIEQASFDRGFHSPENQTQLAAILTHACLPKAGSKQAAQQEADASLTFREQRRRHPGVESAIGALQAGNGLERCRDRTEVGFERYVALGVLGRNLHVLGKLLIAQEDTDCKAAFSKRAA